MNPAEKRPSILTSILALLLLALMAVLAGGAALRESVTLDEASHIGAGVSYLQKLDLRMNPEHPPLPKVLAAIPLVIRGVRADYNHISWTFSEKFFPSYLGQWVFGESLLEKWNDPKSILKWARAPMLALTLLLGCALFVLARRLGGRWGGLFCLSLFVSTPAFLTFGPLVHTDIAVALFCLLALWTFANVWREPSRKNVLLFALCLAGALLSKFTAGLLFFAFLAFALSLRLRPVPVLPGSKGEAKLWRKTRWRATLLGILYAAVVVYVFYLVFSWHQPTNALYRLGNGQMALFFRRALFPPVLYLRGVFWVVVSGVRPTFILGRSYSHGVWFYFPVVFALKSPLAFLLLLPLSLIIAVTRKFRSGDAGSAISPRLALHWRVLWVSLLVFTGACILSPLDISIRHFSVPLMLLLLLLAPVPQLLGELRASIPTWVQLGTGVVTVMVVSCLFTAVRAYPYYFPFVNSLSMGNPAYTLMNDSNVDWNQSLPEVKRFGEQHGLQKLLLDEYGFSDPTPFVPQARLWDCQKPAPEDAGEWVVVSAGMILDGHNCGWLMQYPNESLAGGSMYAVRLHTQIPAPGRPGGPPLPSAFRNLGGAPIDIQMFFVHLNQHPEDLPRGFAWMITAFQSMSKSPGPPPKPPWEP
ncbi:MAG TPA: glycosyltransferase family 39 protein [Candidatus Acidoferrum sp.]|nr:glycosyltransferase family 39 protein [Candidatus Acidoferrum sp.]